MLFVKSFPVAEGQDMALLGHDREAIARFASLLLTEIAATATDEQMSGFFLSIGKRLAASYPTGNVRELERLTQHANLVWQAFNWGHVRFDMDDEGIDIFHEDLPRSLEGDAQGLWSRAAPLILQGAYDAWFRQVAGGGRLSTSIQRHEAGRVELRHGI
jgi:hypothetical protein